MFLLQTILAAAAVVVPCAVPGGVEPAPLVCTPGAEPAQVEEFAHDASAVLHADRLIHLDEKGRVGAWRLRDGSFDSVMSAKLARDGLTHLASDGKQLWAVDATKVYRWSSQDFRWQSAGSFDRKWDSVQGFVVAGGAPLLVLNTRVINLKTNRTYTIRDEGIYAMAALDKMEGELWIGPDVDGSRRRYFPGEFKPFFGCPLCDSLGNAATVLGTESMLWIGTSKGEWGGTLFGLNPANGKWVEHRSFASPVTGITQIGSGELMVSWSLSHWEASTTIRRHRPDAEPVGEVPSNGSKYYQTVAFNPFDGTLYGVDQRDVVRIVDGRPMKLAELDGRVFGKEIHALGVAPGISSLLPFGPGSLIVVPKSGMPWLLRDNRLTRLTTP